MYGSAYIPSIYPGWLRYTYYIAKKKEQGDIFKIIKDGTHNQILVIIKKMRHPNLSLRRPDAPDYDRATMRNVNAIRSYCKILKETLDCNGLTD